MAHVEGIESTRKNLNHALYRRFFDEERINDDGINAALGHCDKHANDDYTLIRFLRTSTVFYSDGSIHPDGSTCDKCKRITNCTYISVHLLDWEYTDTQKRLHELYSFTFDDRMSLITWCHQCLMETMKEEFGADTRCPRCNSDSYRPVFPVETSRLQTITRVKRCNQ